MKNNKIIIILVAVAFILVSVLAIIGVYNKDKVNIVINQVVQAQKLQQLLRK